MRKNNFNKYIVSVLLLFFFIIFSISATDLPVASGGEVVTYYHADHLGSTRAVTDAAGAVIEGETHDFYPYGEEINPPVQTKDKELFTGKMRDAESGLDYFGARYYSNSINRFISSDWGTPIKASMANPQEWNQYLYCANNPVNRIDIDGHWHSSGHNLIYDNVFACDGIAAYFTKYQLSIIKKLDAAYDMKYNTIEYLHANRAMAISDNNGWMVSPEPVKSYLKKIKNFLQTTEDLIYRKRARRWAEQDERWFDEGEELGLMIMRMHFFADSKCPTHAGEVFQGYGPQHWWGDFMHIFFGSSYGPIVAASILVAVDIIYMCNPEKTRLYVQREIERRNEFLWGTGNEYWVYSLSAHRYVRRGTSK